MDDKAVQDTKVFDLRQAVETVRERFSSVRLETRMVDGDTAVSVRFIGDTGNLSERQFLVSQLVEYLPPTLSLLGVKQEPQSGESKAT